MNLSYTLPRAEENIIAGIKKHTCRKDRTGRWREGLLIHHCYSFRSTGGYKCFHVNRCTGVQQLFIILVPKEKVNEGWTFELRVNINRKWVNAAEFAKNDGFENEDDLINWFFPRDAKGKIVHTMWAGKLINWTSFIYTPLKNVKRWRSPYKSKAS